MSRNEKGVCPIGGDWYTCTAQSPTFFGCCTSNPCRGDNTGCPVADLRAAGIGSGTNPDATANGTYWPNVVCARGQWWTCDTPQNPTFQGCCDVNPCNGVGCPAASLQQAAFRTVPAELSPTAVVTSSSTTSSPTSSSSPPGESSGSSSPNIGAIAGGVAAGVAILIIGLAILWMCRRRRQKKSFTSASSLGPDGADQSRANESEQNEPVHYSLLGIPQSSKYAPVSMRSPPTTPGPPPYQSPKPDVHEIDSTHLHEVGEMVQPSAAVQALHRRTVSHEVESPIVQAFQRPNDHLGRWNPRQQASVASVEIGDGIPRSGANTPVNGMPSSNENEGGNSTLNPNENQRGQTGRDTYVRWQSMSP